MKRPSRNVGSCSLLSSALTFFGADDFYIDLWPSGSYGKRKETIAWDH
jgi:hypothetical protein